MTHQMYFRSLSIVEWTIKATNAFEHPDNCADWYKLERFDSA